MPTSSPSVYEMTICRNSILSGTEFILSMTKIPHDDILEGLYKSRIREFEKLKTVLELYDLDIHRKKLGFDSHRLKTLVKRSIEQEIFEIIILGAELVILRRTPWSRIQGTKQRVQRILGDCWQLETVCERRQLQFPPRCQ